MSLRLKAHPDAVGVRVRASGWWVGGRSVSRWVCWITNMYFMLYCMYTYSVCVYIGDSLSDGALGLGQKIFVWRFLPCLPHCLFIILRNAIRLTPFSISASKPISLFRYQFISFTKYCNFFYEYLIMCKFSNVWYVWRKKRGEFFVFIFSWFWSTLYQNKKMKNEKGIFFSPRKCAFLSVVCCKENSRLKFQLNRKYSSMLCMYCSSSSFSFSQFWCLLLLS